MNLVELAQMLDGRLHVCGTLVGPHPPGRPWNAKVWEVFTENGQELYGNGETMDEALLDIVMQIRGKTLYRKHKDARERTNGFAAPEDLMLR